MIIYLNGTSSSGKTSIAKELQTILKEPYFYFSIDTLLYSLCNGDLEAIMGKRPYRQKLDWDAIFEGYFASVGALLATGNNVIADCPVYSQKLAQYFLKYIAPISEKMIVKVECPLSTLEHREKARGDRAVGVARKQFEGIFQYLSFDAQVNSDKSTPFELASLISSLVPSGPSAL